MSETAWLLIWNGDQPHCSGLGLTFKLSDVTLVLLNRFGLGKDSGDGSKGTAECFVRWWSHNHLVINVSKIKEVRTVGGTANFLLQRFPTGGVWGPPFLFFIKKLWHKFFPRKGWWESHWMTLVKLTIFSPTASTASWCPYLWYISLAARKATILPVSLF